MADERIILHTIAGDIVLALYPDVAPRHVEQILKLSRAGLYDTTHFFSLVPGFYSQLSGATDRSSPPSPDQRGLVHRLKAEFSGLHHQRGTLSMARDDRDPDSAETSFSIILADWPEGDRRYTIFGEVESGMEVVDEFLKVPRDAEGRPVIRLSVLKAEVIRKAGLAAGRLAPAQPVDLSQAGPSMALVGLPQSEAVACGILLMVLIGVGAFVCATRYPAAVVPLNLMNVLIGIFLLMIIATPIAHQHPALAVALFGALLGTLKLMSRFESPAS
ncbi:MAG: peptidylprolyl isomerase [Elusimicrobia bacterium]|nr:peptidylprolyl isomerase [Elusimicrobiota bacterium]